MAKIINCDSYNNMNRKKATQTSMAKHFTVVHYTQEFLSECKHVNDCILTNLRGNLVATSQKKKKKVNKL